MLSKKDIQLIRSLDTKKYRQKYHKYLAEGEKICLEIIRATPGLIYSLYALPRFIEKYHKELESLGLSIVPVDEPTLRKISCLKTPNQVLAVVHIPDRGDPDFTGKMDRVLYLDDVRDPGNMGTILRSAEWFGWDLVVLSPDCVDPYNPKVVQAAMGSLARLDFTILSLEEFLDAAHRPFQLYFAEMSGSNAFQTSYLLPLVLVMGNESRGITLNLRDHKVTSINIPGNGRQTESLNVAVAASILMAQISQKK